MALRAEERIVAGGRGDLLLVHHLRLRGSNRAIGRHLGEIARGRYGAQPVEPDEARARAHDALRCRNPIAFERLLGIAEAFGSDEGACALGAVAPAAMSAGCGIAWLPPRTTAASRPVISRSFDAVLDPPTRGVPPVRCPYVLELHPDEGHASIAVVALDFLGAVEGVNAEGLAVAMASDEETRGSAARPSTGSGRAEAASDEETRGSAARPSTGSGRAEARNGDAATCLDGVHVVRWLLDTCASAAEARAALRTLERGGAAPAHYLVADRRGEAFAFEPTVAPPADAVVEASDRPLVLTNHPIHRYTGDRGLPRGDGPAGTYARYRRLRSALAELPLPYRAEHVRALGACGFAEGPPATGLRTLWHAIYDIRERALEVSFLLRDGPLAVRPGERYGGRTEYLPFRLAA